MDTLKSFGAPFSINASKTRYGSSAGRNWNLGVMLNKDNEITVGYKNKRQFQSMMYNYINDKRNGVEWPREDIMASVTGGIGMSNAITEFKGNNFFLSNFFVTPVFYQGIRFENNEAAFQAAKCSERMQEFCGLNPQTAKRIGRRVELRPDWEEVKYDVMYRICKAKFLQNPDLFKRLLDTGDAELVEGNTWGDTVWGVCNGVGENNLGKTLMRIRDELHQFQSDPMGTLVDEVGEEHGGGCGWSPIGNPCGECNSLSCGACPVHLSRE